MAVISLQIKDDNGTTHNLVFQPAGLTDAPVLLAAQGAGYVNGGQTYEDYLLAQLIQVCKNWHNAQTTANAIAAIQPVVL